MWGLSSAEVKLLFKTAVALILFTSSVIAEIVRGGLMFARLRRSPYRNYTGKRYRNSQEREKVLYIMALTPDSDARRIARRIEQVLGNAVRMTQTPASEYEGYTYLKVYSRDADKANMLNILRQRIGVERVITFGSIPGQYDVYVHDDGGDSAVKMMKGLVEGQLLPVDA